MTQLLLSPAARIAATLLVLGLVYFKGRADGRQAILDRIAAERIEIIQDGRKVDETVLGADDDLLCVLLGGCMRDSSEAD